MITLMCTKVQWIQCLQYLLFSPPPANSDVGVTSRNVPMSEELTRFFRFSFVKVTEQMHDVSTVIFIFYFLGGSEARKASAPQEKFTHSAANTRPSLTYSPINHFFCVSDKNLLFNSITACIRLPHYTIISADNGSR